MTVKIWRDHASQPYAVLAAGRLLKVGREARRQPVDRLMRRLYFRAGVGVARKAASGPSQSDEPGSRRWQRDLFPARSLLASGLAC